jgi:hypothetical protein
MNDESNESINRSNQSYDGRTGWSNLKRKLSKEHISLHMLTMTSKEETENEKQPLSWLQYAALGDSTAALVGSFLLLVISVVVALSMDDREIDQAYRKLGPPPKMDPPRVFQFQKTPLVSNEMRKAFEKDGVIAVRGLIDQDSLKLLDAASMGLIQDQQQKDKLKPRGALSANRTPRKRQFYATNHSIVLQQSPDLQDPDKTPFLKVALMSDIPHMAAELLQLDKNETLRVMRDIFLAKDEEQFICGWHVDDTGFWPATAEAPGINAWIALDDMPVEQGGGFALAVGSHAAPWREEAYNVTGSTHTFPKDGFRSASDMLENRMGNGTCNIKTSANHLYRRMEETRRVYDIQRGDIIFTERWLFHRTVPYDREAINSRIARDGDPLLSRRYSIRYGPGDSEIPKGWGTEISVLWDEKNGTLPMMHTIAVCFDKRKNSPSIRLIAGLTADEVASQDAPWYPKAWPAVSEEELKQIETIVERMPTVTKKFEARRKQLRPRGKPYKS